MQIQRIQTLYMLLALIALALFIFLPMGCVKLTLEAPVKEMTVELTAFNQLAVGVPAIAAAIATLISIFVFKRMKLQNNLMVFDIVVTCLAAIALIINVTTKNAALGSVQGEVTWSWTWILVAVAIIAETLALRAIKSDHRLLKSYNRLR